MKKRFILFLVYCLLPAAYCFSGVWTQKANFGGGFRAGAAAFSIGDKGYVGTGRTWGPIAYYADFWEYNTITDTWTQKANVPAADSGFGGVRAYAVGFSIGNKGYMGTGELSNLGDVADDFWEYDTTANAWTQKANVPAISIGGRSHAVGFSIGSKGYIGTGTGIPPASFPTGDFYEYDPAADTWTVKAYATGGLARTQAVGFSIGNKGYIGTGRVNPGCCTPDFWEYDPVLDVWTQKANVPGDWRVSAVGFSILGKGYIGTGAGLGGTNDFWEYDPATNTWVAIPNFGGVPRWDAVAFSIGSCAYVGTGDTGSTPQLNDFWQYCEFVGINELSNSENIYVYPNPSEGKFQLAMGNGQFAKGTIEVYNVLGQKVESLKVQGSKVEINLSAQAKGIYFVRVTTAGKSFSQKIVIQ